VIRNNKLLQGFNFVIAFGYGTPEKEDNTSPTPMVTPEEK